MAVLLRDPCSISGTVFCGAASRCVAMMVVSERIESCGESTSVRRAISEHSERVEISKIDKNASLCWPARDELCDCDRHLIMLDTSDYKRRLTIFASLRDYEASGCSASCSDGHIYEHILTD
jgi:hypothetical protein